MISAHDPKNKSGRTSLVIEDVDKKAYLSSRFPETLQEDKVFGNPSGIIYAIVPNVGVGSLIYVEPPEYAFNKIKDGVYNNLRIRLLKHYAFLDIFTTKNFGGLRNF